MLKFTTFMTNIDIALKWGWEMRRRRRRRRRDYQTVKYKMPVE